MTDTHMKQILNRTQWNHSIVKPRDHEEHGNKWSNIPKLERENKTVLDDGFGDYIKGQWME